MVDTIQAVGPYVLAFWFGAAFGFVVCAFFAGNRIRGLLYQSREEAKVVMEAAQDIMEVVDSIRYKTKHGKEE
ncbi:MAG: hypothetical protein PUE51_05795 [Veillonellaceae bacterium]|nr:hypothetical protein [Veillonellaceae bacterium]